MTTLRSLIGTMTEQAQAAQVAAETAGTAARDAVAPLEAVLDVAADRLTTLEDTVAPVPDRVAALEDALDVLILDALMGGAADV